VCGIIGVTLRYILIYIFQPDLNNLFNFFSLYIPVSLICGYTAVIYDVVVDHLFMMPAAVGQGTVQGTGQFPAQGAGGVNYLHPSYIFPPYNLTGSNQPHAINLAEELSRKKIREQLDLARIEAGRTKKIFLQEYYLNPSKHAFLRDFLQQHNNSLYQSVYHTYATPTTGRPKYTRIQISKKLLDSLRSAR
jgi:hypothetical protein